ncbi:uncharacterized protein BJ171DRAFT_513335 [Polychytrium aggregatum]|uniref:uncharacterized protein n=1 Tax=Polychytrium aggregatum TaxID=110093 RepID=UPI0022FF088B|nr:uncharacterized protein BJ171DRAFT_513335 [Polychytrium aggregatum]KAI9202521.1 hypothetical protein BJ171DRAFT_513335 [Polychytrium aggregatum]
MKLVRKNIEKDASGSVTLVAEEAEDMWHTYNLLTKGDLLEASTIRKVVSESSTGSTDKTSVRLTLRVAVETVEFDAQGGILRVNGKNTTENKYVKLGGYHTIDVELNRKFTIFKEEWDVIAMERIDSACDVTQRADVAAVTLEEGLAIVCLVTQNMTVVRQRLECPVPRKRLGSTTNHDKGLRRFFEQTMEAILRHINFDVVKVLILASPGFIKDQLFKFLMEEAIRQDNKVLLENKSKILLVHCSSGQKHALQEILQEPAVQARLADTKFAQEVKALDRFYTILAQDPARAFYGYDYVALAASRGGIETLMLSDALFRSDDVATRRKYIDLVEQTRAMGGSVLIFSALHSSGEQLTQLTGVAAILNFSMPSLEDEVAQAQETAGNAGDDEYGEDL